MDSNQSGNLIRPSVGRIVLFFNNKAQPEPWAAIVTRVHGDRMVNLTLFPPDAMPAPASSVVLRQPDDAEPAAGAWCEWMQYQQAQAAKAAELEAAA